MQTLADLDLPHLPMEEPAFGEDPMKFFAAARTRHPWLATSNFGLVVHEFTAIHELFRQDKKLRPAYDGIVEQLGAKGTPWGRFTEEQMISLPAEKHLLLRNVLAARFTPRFASEMRPVMRAVVTHLLDEWAPKGSFDFEEFASYFPISVMFSLVGAPLDAVPAIRADLETLGLAFSMDKSRVPALQEAIGRLDAFVQSLVKERRANPRTGATPDVLDMLLEANDAGGITERQVFDVIMFFFIAGYDTSKNVLTFIMYLMLKHPEIYQRCAIDHEYCGKVVEEALRYYNPGSTFRFANEDIVFREVLLPKGTMIFFTLNISGRDPVSFEDPERFDPDRQIAPNQRHVSFGLGIHTCLGQYIARAQLQEALHQIPQRILNPRLVGEIGWRPYPGIWGIRGLPIEFTPAQAA
jgi:cytochrome P450